MIAWSYLQDGCSVSDALTVSFHFQRATSSYLREVAVVSWNGHQRRGTIEVVLRQLLTRVCH
ncbi:MAG: hypothetical protein OER22_07895 [Gammaproteobacteria bacterium]|nr:hypothetical protein [Gammaproteobacteria bacterium]MDH3552522.1 hypothetical protein [Gammaproteobacteria bacterium]